MNSDIKKLNLIKGLIIEHVPPEKLISFLKLYPEDKRFELHPILQQDSALFYIMRNIKHVKKWQMALNPIVPINEWDRVNEKGNNVFLEAVEYKHLKAAKRIAALGANINQENNNGENFIDLLSLQVRDDFSKRKWFSYLFFINSFMENNYPVALGVKNLKSIKNLVDLSEDIFKKNKKQAVCAYEPYWDDAINFCQSIKEKIDYSQANAFRRVLNESLPERLKTQRMKI